MWLAETKGEMPTNVGLKNAAAEMWCQKMSDTKYGRWRYLFAQQIVLEAALLKDAEDLSGACGIVVPEELTIPFRRGVSCSGPNNKSDFWCFMPSDWTAFPESQPNWRKISFALSWLPIK